MAEPHWGRIEHAQISANGHPEQRDSLAQALKMFSVAPAYAAFQERDRGSIEVGRLADFTVLSADIMTVPEPQILSRCHDGHRRRDCSRSGRRPGCYFSLIALRLARPLSKSLPISLSMLKNRPISLDT